MDLSTATKTQEFLAVADLPADVLALLRKARTEVASRRRLGEEAAVIHERALKAVSAKARNLSANSTDLDKLGDLSEANALVVAAASPGDLTAEVAVDGLLPLANLFGSVGRELEARGEPDAALDRYLRGLRLLVTLRVHRPWYSVSKVSYWLMARLGSIVGRLAAERPIGLRDMLVAFDSNMEPLLGLLGDGDTRAPRAFAALAYARRFLALYSGPSEAESLRHELTTLTSELEPRQGPAKERFDGELQTIFAQLEVNCAPIGHGAFRWA